MACLILGGGELGSNPNKPIVTDPSGDGRQEEGAVHSAGGEPEAERRCAAVVRAGGRHGIHPGPLAREAGPASSVG
jgi:hypothetical protein